MEDGTIRYRSFPFGKKAIVLHCYIDSVNSTTSVKIYFWQATEITTKSGDDNIPLKTARSEKLTLVTDVIQEQGVFYDPSKFMLDALVSFKYSAWQIHSSDDYKSKEVAELIYESIKQVVLT